MTRIEKQAQEWANDQKFGVTGSLARGYEVGFKAARDEIVAVLEEVGPGAPDTMGVTYEFGEETRVDNNEV